MLTVEQAAASRKRLLASRDMAFSSNIVAKGFRQVVVLLFLALVVVIVVLVVHVAQPKSIQKPIRPEQIAKPEQAQEASIGVNLTIHRPEVQRTASVRVSVEADDRPRMMNSGSQVQSGFKIPVVAKQSVAHGKWVPANETIQIAGLTIPGGLLYVGETLSGAYGAQSQCLLNPALPVAATGDPTLRQLDYWPSYSSISSNARRAYLEWLAQGRANPRADIGFVFLFFYGLERRVLVDARADDSARQDLSTIATELKRLLELYGSTSESFQRYASELLEHIELSQVEERLYEKPVPDLPSTYDVPLYVRIALGQASLDKAPVPPALAFAWATSSPNIFLRTAAQRCPEKFEQLFLLTYSKAYGKGLSLPPNRTKLKVVYRPAAREHYGTVANTMTFSELPDVTILTAPVEKLRVIVDQANARLDPYSRFVGKDPDAAATVEALLLLPLELWPEDQQKSLAQLRMSVGENMQVVTLEDLLTVLGWNVALTRPQLLIIASRLREVGIEMEPDVLGGARVPKADDTVVLFAGESQDANHTTSAAFEMAALTLRLAAAVAQADGEFSVAEQEHLSSQVLAWEHLTQAHRQRLSAHLKLLITTPVLLSTLRKKLEPLSPEVKEGIAAFMATLIRADGIVSPEEVKVLEKAYKALGVNADRVFSDLHAVSTGGSLQQTTKAGGLKLDPARIAALQRDSERVSQLLSSIFNEEESAQAQLPVETPTDQRSNLLFGLDEAHSTLARLLLSRPTWSRDELADVTADMDLMLDGALERLNEASFDLHDLSFFEGEDPVEINVEILKKLEA